MTRGEDLLIRIVEMGMPGGGHSAEFPVTRRQLPGQPGLHGESPAAVYRPIRLLGALLVE